MLKKKPHRLIFGYYGVQIDLFVDAIFNSDHKRNVRDMGLNWQIVKYHKDPMKECKMRCKTKSRGGKHV